MKIIVGLGNPGIKYVNNRHNIGHLVIDALQNLKLKDKILKSDKHMNDSGLFIKNIKNKYPKMQLTDLYVVHDDLDIPLGLFKVQFGKGPKDHNGLNDIYDKLGTKDFWHIRIGVDNRSEDQRLVTKGKDYVLQDFAKEEKATIDSVIKQICKKLVVL
ncbi:MAG: aminoacyl-tRNA hydrolase [bacterium]|nr:MAG: aminoacyl-tRNA hydrolase [bacterium]